MKRLRKIAIEQGKIQVKIDDIIGSDEIYTILMGDQVESCREYIENNARNVVIIDI